MKSIIVPIIIAIISFIGIISLSTAPSDIDAEKSSASWKQQASKYSISEVEYMRRNGTFKK